MTYVSLTDLLWGGYRLANVILFIALGVIAIECALILRRKYEYSKDPLAIIALILMVLAGLLKFVSTTRFYIYIRYFIDSIVKWVIDILNALLAVRGPDAIFSIIVIIPTVLVLLIALGCYKPRVSRFVREWRHIIKLCGIVVILLFIYYYPTFIANDSLQQLMSEKSGTEIILTPINSSTSLIPNVSDNKFFLISYQNNKYYVREMNSSSPGPTKYFIIPDSQVKYAQIKAF